MQALLITVLSLFMTTVVFAQEENEQHSIKIKYSSTTIEVGEFSEICEIISSEYPEFDCSEENPKMVKENEESYLLISIKRRKKVRLVFKTTDPGNVDIEKIHRLEEKLDAY